MSQQPTPPAPVSTGPTLIMPQVITLTLVVSMAFLVVMGVIVYEYILRGDGMYAVPFGAGWGVILTTMGALLHRLTTQ